MTLIQERNEAIIKAILNKPLPRGRYFNPKDYPASRFYISEKQAQRHVYLYMRKIVFRSAEKRRLQKELFDKYTHLLSQRPKLSQADIFCRLVMSPASEYFISYNVLQRIFWRNRIANNKLIQNQTNGRPI